MYDVSPYEVLGVAKTATQMDIKAAYLRLMKKVHLDRSVADFAPEDVSKNIHNAVAIIIGCRLTNT
jgi:curved DNA-binding protein CbpA